MLGYRSRQGFLPTITSFLVACALATGCRAAHWRADSPLNALAVATFLADIAQNVAGERLTVEALIPAGVDPHAFEPTPQDAARVAKADVLIINGAGLETFLDPLLENAGSDTRVIEASAGLTPRALHEIEEAEEHEHHHHHEGDPHFWLDPNNVIHYVENIRDGLSRADPEGAAVYAANAEAYIAQLRELDAWIVAQVAQIPPERRLLVTNHESFGYFADRYGFRVVGAIVPSVSTGASPSAGELARLIEDIRASGAPAIFLETGANPQLAEQIAREAGVQVVTGLYTHSTGSEAPTYIEMMRYDVRAIVEALR
jgi:ABC-type Zn uptake system ZnuABC Zn-binding protein ZnuA